MKRAISFRLGALALCVGALSACNDRPDVTAAPTHETSAEQIVRGGLELGEFAALRHRAGIVERERQLDRFESPSDLGAGAGRSSTTRSIPTAVSTTGGTTPASRASPSTSAARRPRTCSGDCWPARTSSSKARPRGRYVRMASTTALSRGTRRSSTRR